nr:unnamed protein product [Spirometra erinaceieuropaei]
MKTLTREINATLLALENSGAISPIDRRMARAQETALARFYGLPKVHKRGRYSPAYRITKAHSNLRTGKVAVPTSQVPDLRLKNHSQLLNAILGETKRRPGSRDHRTTPKREIRRNGESPRTRPKHPAPEVLSQDVIYVDGTISEQVKGTPMESPSSGIIAEVVLQRLESLVLQHHRPKFWARYLDDTFVVIERDQVLTFKERLKSVFPDIQFTMEEEKNNQLAFLDVLVCRNDCGGLKTKVFGKATNTTQILNFNSNHPISHKRSCVRALYRRVETNCSEMDDRAADLQYLRRVMRANGYPSNFVNRCETGLNPSALQSFEDTPIIETVQFTEGMVLTELLRLKESKSPGPDGIPAKILKELAGELSKPVSMLFHTSFETGYLPPDWKSAWITPLHKGGSRVSANSYRPVSLTSICSGHVGDQQSAEIAVKSGVPQGSVLGPTLFLVYVNDCANKLNCDVAMFADDIKIWSTIRSEVDEARLQTILDHLEQWSKDWLLPFNVNKCTFLRVGRTSSPNHTVYLLTGKPLQEVDAQKDLGVWITTSLKPSLQCSKVVKSAMSMLYIVKRAFSSFDEDCFAKVFQTFVRPHLQFAIQAWRPWTAKDLESCFFINGNTTSLRPT